MVSTPISPAALSNGAHEPLAGHMAPRSAYISLSPLCVAMRLNFAQ